MGDAAIYFGNLLVAVACHLAAWEIGRRIHRRILGAATSGGDGSEAAFFSAILGFVALGFAGLLLGAVSVLYAPVLAACVLVPAASGAVHLLRTRPWRSWKPAAADIVFLAAIVIVIAAIPLALMPVLEWDDNVYHLAIPQAYLDHHRIAYLFKITANMPHLGEVLYLFPMSLGDFTAPKVFNLFFNLWTLVGLRAFARGETGRAIAGVVGLLYLSSPAVLWHLGRGYVEPILGAFLLAAVVAFLRWVRGGSSSYLWLTGIGCGAAAAVKYQGWIFSFAILLFVGAAILVHRDTGRARIRLAVRVLLPFALIVGPWLVKNLMLTGNPIYPLAFGVFGGKDLSDIEVLHLRRSFAAHGDPKTPLRVLVLPYRLVVRPEGDFKPGYSATMIVLVLLALGLPSSYRPSSRYLLGMTVVGFVGWALSCQIGRYLVAWAPVTAMTASLALARAPARRWMVGGLSTIVVAVAALQLSFDPVVATLDVPRTAIFQYSREHLVGINTNFDLCTFLNREIPANGKVLGMWESRLFFLRRELISDSLYEAPACLAGLRRADDAAVFADTLRAQGITHVVINDYAANVYFDQAFNFSLLDERLYPASRLARDRALLTQFIENQLEPFAKDGWNFVFRLKERARS